MSVVVAPGHAGINIDLPNPEDATPIFFFKQLFISNAFMTNVSNITNLYARQRLRERAPLPQYSWLSAWKATDITELSVFFAILVTMGLTKKMNIEDYWSTGETVCTPFIPKYMSKDRFLLLLGHLHFTDNEAAVPRGEMGYDPLYKLRPVISHFQMVFSDIYSPERDVSYDEGTCAFKGVDEGTCEIWH